VPAEESRMEKVLRERWVARWVIRGGKSRRVREGDRVKRPMPGRSGAMMWRFRVWAASESQRPSRREQG
jgi:hypothetical protein